MVPATLGIPGFALRGKRHFWQVFLTSSGIAQQQRVMKDGPEALFSCFDAKSKTNQMLLIYKKNFKAATTELLQ